MKLKEICGCIHWHTTFSDGECGYEEIIRAAQNAGIDYICVTDHMTLEGQGAGWEGVYGGLLVHTGYEHEDEKDENHYLALGVNKLAEGLTEPQEYINRIKKMGGAGFIAHPTECRSVTKGLPPPYPWTKWDVTGFDGIEIWNQVSDWIEHLDCLRSDPIRMILRLFSPTRLLRDAPKELLAKWDDMNLTRFVSAIGGVDAHNRKIKICGPFIYQVFKVKEEMRGVRTHLFVDAAKWAGGDGADAAKMSGVLVDAMRNGRGFISNCSHGDARGCEMFLSDGSGAIQYPGRWGDAQPPLSLPLTMNVKLTRKAKIMLIRNGKVIKSTSSKNAGWTITEPGVYRIEARRGGSAWIYSNPFPVGQYPIRSE